MAKVKKFELESPAPIPDEEDEETLAAIDEGIRDAKSGQPSRPKKSASGCPSRLPPPQHAKGADLAEIIGPLPQDDDKAPTSFWKSFGV
jgi:hypothetical protein